MIRELDVSDAIDGINLPVEILHGFDGVGVRNLGCCVNPQAAWGGRDGIGTESYKLLIQIQTKIKKRRRRGADL
jgi:hypothetical protein